MDTLLGTYVALVREIYRLTIFESKGAMAIARDLNRTHIKHPGRLLWNYQHILEILRPEYVQTLYTVTTVLMLGAKVVKTRPDQWVVKPDAYEQIVDVETFAPPPSQFLHDRTFYQSDEESQIASLVIIARGIPIWLHDRPCSRRSSNAYLRCPSAL